MASTKAEWYRGRAEDCCRNAIIAEDERRGFFMPDVRTFHFRFKRSAKAGVLEPFTRNPASLMKGPSFSQRDQVLITAANEVTGAGRQPRLPTLIQPAPSTGAGRACSDWRLMRERSSAADKRGVEPPLMAHQMLQFKQPVNSWRWRSISVSGCLHSKQ